MDLLDEPRPNSTKKPNTYSMLEGLSSEIPQKVEAYYEKHPLLRSYVERAESEGLDMLADGIDGRVDYEVGGKNMYKEDQRISLQVHLMSSLIALMK